MRTKLPSYGFHKPSGQARCYVAGKSVYLGPFGSEESRVLYGQIVARLVGGLPVDPIAGASKRHTAAQDAPEADPGPSVAELCLTFMRHAESHYVKNGKTTSQVHLFRSTIKPLNALYGLTPAKDFGPLALKAVRAKMIELEWARDTVNAAVGRVRRIFKHAVENELVGPDVLAKLQAVAPLLAGRTEAHDNPKRTAVSDAHIRAVRKLVTPRVRDLIDLQRLTGARSGELLSLTSRMINRTGKVWFAKLEDHKTSHHGQGRVLHFGPKSQMILRRYLNSRLNAPLFKMTGAGYRRAVTRACEKAKITRWVPHQLRHTAADKVRSEFGLEATQAVLGHSKADMSEHYAQASAAKAAEVARQIG